MTAALAPLASLDLTPFGFTYSPYVGSDGGWVHSVEQAGPAGAVDVVVFASDGVIYVGVVALEDARDIFSVRCRSVEEVPAALTAASAALAAYVGQ